MHLFPSPTAGASPRPSLPFASRGAPGLPLPTLLFAALLGAALGGGGACGGDRPDRGPEATGEAGALPSLPAVDALPAASGEFAGSNLLLVTLDTTRADHLACYGARSASTPHLDRLAAEGVLFTHVAAAAPTTLPAHASILTGLYPLHHGARVNGVFRLGDAVPTLAETMEDAGYRTAAFVSAFVLDAQFGVAQGFAHYDDELVDSAAARNSYAERSGDRTTDRAEAWLRDAADARFFCWVHYFDPHAPYTPPPPFADAHPDHPYRGEISFMDSCVGRLVDLLDELELAERTLVVIVGDHGEGLGEHDELVHGYLAYESTLRVPMIMRHASRLGGGVRFDRRVSQVDIVPTALSLLGVSAPYPIDGIDLTATYPADRSLYAETLHGMIEFGWAPLAVVYAGERKYIDGPDPELYDLGLDPRELANRLGEDPEGGRAARARLTRLFGAHLALAEGAVPNLDPGAEALDQLAHLGYATVPGEIPEADSRPDPKRMIGHAQAAFEVVMAADDPSLPPPARIAALERAAAEHSDFVLAWKRLARARREAGNLDGAAEALERCIELRPGAADALFDLAMVRSYQNEAENAVLLLRRITAQYPRHVEAQYLLGVILRGQKRSADAAPCFLAAFTQDAEYKRCAEFLLASFLEAGRADELPPLFRDALAADPRSGAPRASYARFLVSAGQADAAERLLREGLALTPDQGTVVIALAGFLHQRPELERRAPEEARAILGAYCDGAGAEDATAWYTRAVFLEHAGEIPAALAAARRAHSLARAQRDADTERTAAALVTNLAGR